MILPHVSMADRRDTDRQEISPVRIWDCMDKASPMGVLLWRLMSHTRASVFLLSALTLDTPSNGGSERTSELQSCSFGDQ